jgi:hypothetical protein
MGAVWLVVLETYSFDPPVGETHLDYLIRPLKVQTWRIDFAPLLWASGVIGQLFAKIRWLAPVTHGISPSNRQRFA